MIDERSSYNTKELLRDMWSFIRPYKGRFWSATILRFTSDVVWLYPPWALGEITTFFAKYERDASLQYFWLLLSGIVGAALYRFTVIEIAKFNGYRLAERIGLESKVSLLKHLFSLDLKWHETMNSGAKLKRISRGGEGVHRILRIFYTNILESALNILAITFIFHRLGIWFSVGFVFFILSYYVFSYIQTKRAERQSEHVNEREEIFESIIFETLNNILTVKTLGLAQALGGHFKKQLERVMKEIRKRIKLFRVREGTLNMYTVAARVTGLTFIGAGIAQGKFEVGVLVMFISYFELVWRATSELAQVTNEVAIHKVEVGRMMALAEVKPTIEGKGTRAFPARWQALTAHDLSFAYRKREVLSGAHITIARREKIGIVGHSGAGKSTLFKILLKLYEDYRGSITIDSIPLREIDRNSYLKHVAVVLQDTELFDLSLKDNITIIAGEEGVDDARLAQALSIAHLDELTKRLPQGADTMIGEKGIRLSGGEKQRLGIARAVYKNPEILFLDEATSHLDAESERKIQDSLHQFFKSVTAIVIAHRLSTIQQMDRIIVLDDGRVAEEGAFEALLAKKGVFYQLWKKQKL